MSWSVGLDAENCIGSGMCVGIAPEYFTDESGVTAPVQEVVEPAEEVVEAAEACPVEAILVRDARTGVRIAPRE